MSEFSKFGKKKLAFALACASVLGGKTSAMNNKINANRAGVKSSQTLGAIGEATFGNVHRNNSNSSEFIDRIKNNKALTAIIGTLGLGAIGTGLYFVLRSGDKQEEIRKQYFEIYKKILNFCLSNSESLDGIIEKNEDKEDELKDDDIIFILTGMMLFGDFKNNEAVFPGDNSCEVKVKFNISEDKTTLHLEIEKNNLENKQKNNYKLNLKIPEIPENKVIKFDDNAVRCKILDDFVSSSRLAFELKDSKIILRPNNSRDDVDCLVTNIHNISVGGMTENWTDERVSDGVVNNKQAKKVRTFVSVSENFKTCVLQDTFYEDEECKNAIGNNKWGGGLILNLKKIKRN